MTIVLQRMLCMPLLILVLICWFCCWCAIHWDSMLILQLFRLCYHGLAEIYVATYTIILALIWWRHAINWDSMLILPLFRLCCHGLAEIYVATYTLILALIEWRHAKIWATHAYNFTLLLRFLIYKYFYDYSDIVTNRNMYAGIYFNCHSCYNICYVILMLRLLW